MITFIYTLFFANTSILKFRSPPTSRSSASRGHPKPLICPCFPKTIKVGVGGVFSLFRAVWYRLSVCYITQFCGWLRVQNKQTITLAMNTIPTLKLSVHWPSSNDCFVHNARDTDQLRPDTGGGWTTSISAPSDLFPWQSTR